MHFPLHQQQQQHDIDNDDRIATAAQQQHNEGAIVRHIASFMSLTDAASVSGADTRVPSWSSFITTPETPGLMALSPDNNNDDGDWALEHYESTTRGDNNNNDEHYHHHHDESSSSLDNNNNNVVDMELHQRLADRQRRYVTQKLSAAVFSHPQSLRSFCVKAHQAATLISKRRSNNNNNAALEQRRRPNIFEYLIHAIFTNNVPLSVLMDVISTVRHVSLETMTAAASITIDSLQSLIHAVVQLLEQVHQAVTLRRRHHASTSAKMLASQGSLDGLLSHRNSFKNLFENHSASDSKILEQLSHANAAAQVIQYREARHDHEALTKHAKQRVQRMMHYNVSLKPFVATVVVNEETNNNYNTTTTSSRTTTSAQQQPSTSGTPNDPNTTPPSPFMCTPKSFPPTPMSRKLVLARGSKFAEDVIFLARDKLRVETGLESDNERTRAMAHALRQASRLAVLNAANVGSSGILLTCGQHVATKLPSSGTHVLYGSTRSMVPLLRNCWAYFEMTILPSTSSNSSNNTNNNCHHQMASLSIGLSTLEMPLNTLVGAWKGSVGLCTTGQVLSGGQWDTSGSVVHAFGNDNSATTVACLVCLNDGTAFETWDGHMVEAQVMFSVHTAAGTTASGSCNNNNNTTTSTTLLVPMEEELFPTLTLHSPGTQVMVRFSAQDVLYARETLQQHQLAENTAIYAVDGSVISTTSTSTSPLLSSTSSPSSLIVHNDNNDDDEDNDEHDDDDDDDDDDNFEDDSEQHFEQEASF